MVTGCVSVSVFASLVGIASSAVQLKYVQKLQELKSIKVHDKIVLLARTKRNTIEVLIFRALIDSYVSHDEFVNNVLKEYDDMNEEIKILKTSRVH